MSEKKNKTDKQINNKILTDKQLNNLSKNTKTKLYYILLQIEDELQYNCKKVSNTINFLQTENRGE